ncbi:MAG: alcohol dehydrogenase catalytic domain-containing protein [Planctomycetaceae bacterium]|nr:alcohol dehydrogenase catalytic domain-containing protein [Planctomycetaceae bacterium]
MLAIAAQRGSTEPHLINVPAPPDPAHGEVLCRTLELGVCGTDRDILHSAAPWTPAGEERLILGHECLARIEAVGLGVTDFRPGELVVPVVRRAFPGQTRRVDLLPFGPFTERGIYHEHGFSQPLWLDRPEYLFRVPAEIADLAVLTEPLAVSEKGVNEALLLTRARLSSDVWSSTNAPRVLVSGMGPIGFTAVLAAVARGWPVTMLGRDEPRTFRASLVERLGGRYQPIEATRFEPADVERDGYDLCLECTGSDDVMLQAASLVRSCGVIVWLGSMRKPQPAMHNVQRLMRDGLVRNHLHIGCVNAAPRDFADALLHLAQLKRTCAAELAALITARVRPEQSLWHYTNRQPQGIKTVLQFE